ncbi:MAG: Acg family FMN-binding oxidoreductase [Bacteroidales bacterium]
MIPDDIFLKIVRSAVKAPSGHNTQPWLFANEKDGIIIKPDFSRSLPIADPGNRELYISLGCAAETAIIAARFYGYNAELHLDLIENQGSIRIVLSKIDHPEQPELFSFINVRQTTRNLYSGRWVSDEDMENLTQIVPEQGVDMVFYMGQEGIESLQPYIILANAIQMNNPDFMNELIQWMRFSEREAMQKGDGLYTSCSGIPSLGRRIGSFVIRNFVTAKSEEKRLLTQMSNTPSLALFTSQNNTLTDWVKTGMVFQRVALVATRLGLCHSCLNLPCQIPKVRDKMMTDLDLDGFPQLIIRMGYAQKMHYSFRRRINDVILR